MMEVVTRKTIKCRAVSKIKVKGLFCIKWNFVFVLMILNLGFLGLNLPTDNRAESKEQPQSLIDMDPITPLTSQDTNPGLNHQESTQKPLKTFTGFIENQDQLPEDYVSFYYTESSFGVGFGISEIYFWYHTDQTAEPIKFMLTFENAYQVQPTGQDRLSVPHNFIYGSDSHLGISAYQEVWFNNLYPNIDLRYYMSDEGLKYDFIVHPRGSPDMIRVMVDSSMEVKVGAEEAFFFSRLSPGTVISDTDLFVYQKQSGQEVQANFRLYQQNVYGFTVGPYDQEEVLVIDPRIMYFSFDEGSGTYIYDQEMGYDGWTYETLWVTGLSYTALEFDGSSSYVTISDYYGDDLFDDINDFSVEFWLKTNESTNGVIFNKGVQPGLQIQTTTSNQNIQLSIFDNTGALVLSLVGSAVINDDQWHHVVVVVERAVGARIYVDGLLDESDPTITSGVSLENSSQLVLGVDETLNGGFFSGSVDEFALYDEALDASTVQTNYLKLEAQKELVLDLQMNSWSSTTVYDSSKFAAHGTTSGSATYTQSMFVTCTYYCGPSYHSAGEALWFDGTTGYVSLQNGSQYDFGLTTDFSFEFWFRTVSTVDSTIFSKGDVYASGIEVALFDGGSRLSFALGFNEMLPINITSVEVINDGHWHHVVFSVDRDTDIALHIDGREDGRFSITTDDKLFDTTSAPTLGRRSATLDHYYSGLLDEFRIYASNQTEVGVLNRYDYYVDAATLLTSLDFDIYGTTVYDHSSYEKDFTNAGGTYTNGFGQYSLFLNGTEYLYQMTDFNYNLSLKTDVSIEFSYRGFTTTNAVLVSKGGSLTLPGYKIETLGINQFLSFTVYGDAGLILNLTSTTPLNDGFWHYIVVVLDRDGGATIFLDGEVDSTDFTSSEGISLDNAVDLTLGVDSVTFENGFVGYLDNFRFMTQALSSEDVILNYQYWVSETDIILDFWLDENSGSIVSDSSIYNHDGLIYGAGWANGFGPLSSGLEFDGVDDYVEVESDGSFKLQTITIGAWVKLSSLNMPSGTILATTADGSPNPDLNPYSLYYNSSDHTICFSITSGGSEVSIGYEIKEYNVGAWHLIMGSFNGTHLSLYIDGHMVDIRAHSGFIDYQSNVPRLYIGAEDSDDDGLPDSHFSGHIDAIVVLNRELWHYEVWHYYTSMVYPEGRLSLLMDMDRGVGTYLLDSSLYGNNGTISGASWTTGMNGSALYFDGVDDGVDIFNSGSLNPTEISVMMWVRFDEGGTENPVLARKEGVFDISLVGTGFSRFVQLTVNSTTLVSNVSLSAGQWYYIGFTYQYGYGASYIDGVLDQQFSTPDLYLPITSAKITLGYNSVGGDNRLNGSLDGLRIYNRAIPDYEIQQLFGSLTPPLVSADMPEGTLLGPLSVLFITVTDPDGVMNVTYSWNNETTFVIGTYEQIPIPLTNGTNVLYITATDLFGNEVVRSFSYLIDRTPPQLTLHSPLDFSMVRSGESVNFSILGGSGTYTYNWDGGTNETVLTSIQPIVPVGDGIHVLQIIATDPLGNWLLVTFTFTVDDTPPIISVVNPPEGSTLTESSTVEVNVTGYNGTLFYSWDNIDFINTSGSIIPVPDSDGNFTLYMQAFDLIGNAQTFQVFYFVDVEAPDVLILSPSNNTLQKPNTFVNVSIVDPNLLSVVYNWNGTANTTGSGLVLTLLPPTPGTWVLNIYTSDTFGHGAFDRFIFYINPNATLYARDFQITYETQNMEWGTGVVVDSDGNNLLVGYTPSTIGMFSWGKPTSSSSVNYDIYLTKLNSTGNGVLFATTIGGSDSDQALDIQLDSDGNIVIVGFTLSADYPLTNDAFDSTNVNGEAFVTILDSTGSTIVFSSFVGGNGKDQATSLAIEGDNTLVITGTTSSTNFPNQGGSQTTLGGSTDTFVLRVGPNHQISYSSYLGGSGHETSNAIIVDASGIAYVVGTTNSTNFPLQSASQSILSGPADAFLTAIDKTTGSVVLSTYVGGSGWDAIHDLTFTNDSRIALVGNTTSADFPLVNPFDEDYGGSSEGILMILDPNGYSVTLSSFFGGSDDDVVDKILVDRIGNLVGGGSTSSTDIPKVNAIDDTLDGAQDAFLFTLEGGSSQLVLSTYLGGSYDDDIQGIAFDADNNVLVVGNTQLTTQKTTYLSKILIDLAPKILFAQEENLTTLKWWSGTAINLSIDDLTNDRTWFRWNNITNLTYVDPANFINTAIPHVEGNNILYVFANDTNGKLANKTLVFFTIPDVDGDRMNDTWEVEFGLDPSTNDSHFDGDLDDLINLLEAELGTNPSVADSDGDGLTDGLEFLVYQTNPLIADTDGDLILDGWEVQHGLDPLLNDAYDDPDNDTIINLWEFGNNTNPFSDDTDEDGFSDEEEIRRGFSPTNHLDCPLTDLEQVVEVVQTTATVAAAGATVGVGVAVASSVVAPNSFVGQQSTQAIQSVNQGLKQTRRAARRVQRSIKKRIQKELNIDPDLADKLSNIMDNLNIVVYKVSMTNTGTDLLSKIKMDIIKSRTARVVSLNGTLAPLRKKLKLDLLETAMLKTGIIVVMKIEHEYLKGFKALEVFYRYNGVKHFLPVTAEDGEGEEEGSLVTLEEIISLQSANEMLSNFQETLTNLPTDIVGYAQEYAQNYVQSYVEEKLSPITDFQENAMALAEETALGMAQGFLQDNVIQRWEYHTLTIKKVSESTHRILRIKIKTPKDVIIARLDSVGDVLKTYTPKFFSVTITIPVEELEQTITTFTVLSESTAYVDVEINGEPVDQGLEAAINGYSFAWVGTSGTGLKTIAEDFVDDIELGTIGPNEKEEPYKPKTWKNKIMWTLKKVFTVLGFLYLVYGLIMMILGFLDMFGIQLF